MAMVVDRVVVDVRASTFAFRAGQLVEQLLLDRGLELARQSGCSVVTAEHVASCLSPTLFDQLLEQARGISHGGTGGGGESSNGDRQAA
jgi:hypothetical protein